MPTTVILPGRVSIRPHQYIS